MFRRVKIYAIETKKLKFVLVGIELNIRLMQWAKDLIFAHNELKNKYSKTRKKNIDMKKIK